MNAAGPGAANRRGGLRVAASLKVDYESVDALVHAYTDNISHGGLFVRTDEHLPVGAAVRLHLELPCEQQEVTAIARVTHIEGESERGGAGMGLEFLDLGGDPIANRIARYLASQGVVRELPPSPAGASAMVLVVDDNDHDRERVAQVVRDSGHTPVMARNGLDALRKALAAPPDIIITDIEMPALDGWQFLRLARARPALSAVPIIFFTARLPDDDRLRGYQLGVSDFIGKSFADEELALCVQRVLEHTRAYPHDITKAGGLRGELAQVSLARLLTLLASERQHGSVLLVGTREIATIHLRDGAVVRIDLDEEHQELEGVQRLFHLLDWGIGRFEFRVGEVTDQDTIGTPVPMALLQHAQQGPDNSPMQ